MNPYAAVIAWLQSEEGEAWSRTVHNSRKAMSYTLRADQAVMGMFNICENGSRGSTSHWTPS